MAAVMQEHNEQMDQEECPWEDIETLTANGISATDVKKLKDAGIHTIAALTMNTREFLRNVKGFSDAEVDKLLEVAVGRKLKLHHQGVGFVTGVEALAKRSRIIKISCGAKAVDAILGGGVETSSITEMYGEFRTGKTQICHTMCVTSQLPLEVGGGNGKVVVIDTEGAFRLERLKPIAEHYGLDPQAVLENVVYCRVYDTDTQIKIISTDLPALLKESGPFRLVIIDSATSLFRVDFQGRGELAERQQKLETMLSKLQKVSEEFNVAVLMTNQVMSTPDGAMSFVPDPKKPVGGHVMAHACCTRLSLKKGRAENRIIQVVDSPSLPPNEASFAITEGGITDATAATPANYELVEPDKHWTAFQKTAATALVQRDAALELNCDVKPYRKWILDPRWAGFFRDFRSRVRSGLAPDGRVKDAFLSVHHFMKQSMQSTLYFTQETVDVDTAVSGTVFQNGKKISAKMRFTAGDLVLKRSLTRPTSGFYYVLHLSAFLLQCQILHARGVPLLEHTNGAIVRTHCSYTSACHSAWPYVTVEGAGCCVLQLLGLTQFEMIPRNPQTGQERKFANWGEFMGCMYTYLYRQE